MSRQVEQGHDPEQDSIDEEERLPYSQLFPPRDSIDDEERGTPYSRLFPARPVEPDPFQHRRHDNVSRHPFNPFDHHNPWDGNPNVTRYEVRSGPGTFTFTSASVRGGEGGWQRVRTAADPQAD